MENKKNVQLLKLGDNIVFGETGVDYTLEAGIVYVPSVDYYTGELKLTIGNSLTLPEKLYTTKSDRKFVDKILKSYNDTDKTLGVLLGGTKGTGKTVMAKQIAEESGLPILTLDNNFQPSHLNKLFAKLENIPMCILFDEFDKLGDRYDSDQLLRVIDGASSCGKNLIVFTCNDVDDVNEYLLDRCSRVRYFREFSEMSASMISEILEDRLTDKTEVKVLTDFILENFNLVSFDNVAAFADEVNSYPNDTYEELFKDMNISQKN